MQLKSLIRYPIDIRRARRMLAKKQPVHDSLDCQNRPIVLDLRTPQLLFDCGRHFASLAHYAQCAGSPFLVRSSQLLLSSIARKIHGREMLADSHAQWMPTNKPLPDSAHVLCDYDSPEHIQMMIGRDIDLAIPVMPYPMHPATLPFAGDEQLQQLRQVSRAGVLFAGNQKPKYGAAKIAQNFGVMSRLEMLDRIAKQFPGRVVNSVSNRSVARPIVISDSRVDKIDASEWLPTLARFQFFLCCPGASQPTCHNMVEAMSVGTVPIIEYADRVTPRLEDGVNAICFSGADGLDQAIQRIERFSAQQLRELSQNAARFYDQHLCGTKFLAGLRDGKFDLSAGKICLPFHEHNFYESALPKSVAGSDPSARRAA
ncbi:MAG: hypothetical protein AB8B91_14045 [Rubripirellula sp.]